MVAAPVNWSTTRGALLWLYGLQAVVLFPLLAGMITRGEVEFWPLWDSGDSIVLFVIEIYIKFTFYSVFFTICYILLGALYGRESETFQLRAFISMWFLITVCIFHTAIFDALYDVGIYLGYPTTSGHELLAVLWITLTVFAIISWHTLSSEKLVRLIQDAKDDVYEEWRSERERISAK